ncbi:hypothetical protein M408DRAFT_18316 [Serendipita vermifera MAFF 305830]|uniref:Uncharacterized protein n=1 Tax=Serendipita vermifera MAFF 305830 TaxID=933852 RepID=A0A0C3ANZ9_SERVB|nr:hypothetical protein M408DRAFT_18316 [Serendipita vermifera MAFF 305830]
MANQLLGLAVLAPLLYRANAATPQVDFDRMGKVAIAGSFAGLDFYSDAQQSSSMFDASTSTIFLRGSDGGLTPIGATNQGGSVIAGCSLGSDKFYFGGTFTSVAGQNVNNIVAYNPQTSTFSALPGGGLDGAVEALWCDSSSQTLWAGGAFHGPSGDSGNGYSGSVALYTPSSNSWSPPGFSGLSGRVSSIVSNSDSSSLFFGGSFITSYAANGSNNTNITSISNPNVPQSTGSTPFSSSLVPFPLSGAEVTAGPSSSRTGLGDVKNIFCPAGADGPGSTWFAQEGFFSQIIIRDFRALTASGIRLGNTFFDGQSTKTFCVTSLPDNQLLTLSYNVPGSEETRTCTEDCPLSTDSSVAFQDFLFTTAPIFGVQINLKEWTGDGAGLHLLQLLSDGSFAPAVVPDDSSCYSPGPSDVQRTGTWTSSQVFTSIPATTQTVLTANVAVGSSASSAPSLTWNIYVSASGTYDVFLLSPGCTNMQNCAGRTSVDVTLSPGGGQAPVTTTVSEANTEDAELLVYSGVIVPDASQGYTVNVKLALAANPTGSGSGGQYTIVADRIIMRLKEAGTSGNGTTGSGNGTGNGTASGTKRAFGVYEWPLRNSPENVNAAGVIPNNTETALTSAAFALYAGLGNSSAAAAQARIASVVPYNGGAVVGGQFRLSDGTTNVALLNNGALSALAGRGLGGTVSSMVLYGDSLFVGGTFNSTADGNTALRNVALYNLASNQWSALGGGVDGSVASLGLSNGHVTLVGNFTRTLVSSTTALGASGLASWDISAGKWVNSGGLLVGKLAGVMNGTAENSQYISGRVSMYLKYGADGAASISNGDNGNAAITPLGARLDSPAAKAAASSNAKRAWAGLNIRAMLAPRQSPGTTIPADGPAPAPSVLNGVFWTNTSSSHEVMIIGGNFSIPDTQVTSLAIYDPEDQSVRGVQGAQVDGIVRALLIVGSKLFVGGEFTLQGVEGHGFAVYDLDAQGWVGGVTGLTASSGQPVVRSLSTLADGSSLIVAGSFTSAGSTQCSGICKFDINALSWATLGSGTTGDVESVSYAGGNSEFLLAAGVLTVGGSQAYLASYSTQNQTWASVGTLPGPVTAVGVNDRNESSVFVAGRTASGAFVSHWDDLPISATSNITQLEMVPLQQEHDSTTLVGSDRVLWISGSLAGTNFTHAASALYDGQTLYPYLVTSTSTGESGSVSSFFHSFSSFSFSSRKYLAVGVVILISIALGAGVVFLIGLIGILWALFARRDDRNFGQDTIVEDDDSVRPSSLLAHVNAAARNTILGTPKPDYYVVEQGILNTMINFPDNIKGRKGLLL